MRVRSVYFSFKLQREDLVVFNGLSDSSVKNHQVFERP